MSNPLVPVISQAKATVVQSDASAFVTGLLALTPLPNGKTADQLTSYNVSVATDGSLRIQANFKS